MLQCVQPKHPTPAPSVRCDKQDKSISASQSVPQSTYRVVSRQVGWLVGGKVCEEDPVPAGHHHILSLDVTVADTMRVSLAERLQQLECYPTLHASTATRCTSRHT